MPDGLWRELVFAYSEPQRAYHDLAHLQEVLALHAQVAREIGWAHPRELYLALAFHDVVYVPAAPDNEEASALAAARAFTRWFPDQRIDDGYVQRLIRLTARHGKLDRSEVTPEEALFLDCDMAVLGSDPARYAAYEAGIAAEYSAVPPERFAAGRRRFLEGLLQRERIFLSEYFHAALEARARENLRCALAR